MDPVELTDMQTKLEDWLSQGYQILADEVEGEIRVTVHYVARTGASGKEREQEFWPLAPEVVELLRHRGIPVARGEGQPGYVT